MWSVEDLCLWYNDMNSKCRQENINFVILQACDTILQLPLAEDSLRLTSSIQEEFLAVRGAASGAIERRWLISPISPVPRRGIHPTSLKRLYSSEHLVQWMNTIPTVTAQGTILRSSNKAYPNHLSLLSRAKTSMPTASIAGLAR